MKAISLMTKEAMERVQVAILDYNMPGMNGCVLAKRLRSAFPELKTILYSGALDIPSREVTSVDVVVSKADGIATLISQVMQFVQVNADHRETLAVR
jgi:CheY-like chemotaxis protein